jgi:hypothetical protein
MVNDRLIPASKRPVVGEALTISVYLQMTWFERMAGWMADGSRPRAVSGEIMTGPPESAAGRASFESDVIDAEYITLPPEGLSSRPSRGEPSLSDSLKSPALSIGSASAPSGGMDMLRTPEPAPTPGKPARGGPLFWTVGVGFAAAAFWTSGGHALVRGAPFIGTEAPQSALSISGVTSRVDTSGVRPMLLVDGEAANVGAAVEHLPPLTIAVTGNDGRITRYRLGTSGRPLAPGETFAFSSRLDVPKNGVKTVSVAFAQ